MLERRSTLSAPSSRIGSRHWAPLALLALVASLLVAVPVEAGAVSASVAEGSATVAAPQPAYGPGRLKNATPPDAPRGCRGS